MAVFALFAYGLGLVGVVWFALDSSRIPSMVWFWSGYSRLGWWATILVGFVAFGVPAFVAAVAWRRERGPARAAARRSRSSSGWRRRAAPACRRSTRNIV